MLLVLSYKPNNCLCSTAECTCIGRLKSDKKCVVVIVRSITIRLNSIPAVQISRLKLCDTLKYICRASRSWSKNKNVTLPRATIRKCDINHWLVVILQINSLRVQIASEPGEKFFQIKQLVIRGIDTTIIKDESQFLACGCFTWVWSDF